ERRPGARGEPDDSAPSPLRLGAVHGAGVDPRLPVHGAGWAGPAPVHGLPVLARHLLLADRQDGRVRRLRVHLVPELPVPAGGHDLPPHRPEHLRLRPRHRPLQAAARPRHGARPEPDVPLQPLPAGRTPPPLDRADRDQQPRLPDALRQRLQPDHLAAPGLGPDRRRRPDQLPRQSGQRDGLDLPRQRLARHPLLRRLDPGRPPGRLPRPPRGGGPGRRESVPALPLRDPADDPQHRPDQHPLLPDLDLLRLPADLRPDQGRPRQLDPHLRHLRLRDDGLLRRRPGRRDRPLPLPRPRRRRHPPPPLHPRRGL
ncbi:MAG: Maltodextrin ABC transporter, permease protein MdxF, partial [uncultured Thermomicrobiales bacterium]